MSNFVPPSGPRDAKIVLVGEAPGEHEVSQGLPFVGPSGQMLSMMLANSGIDRNQCYLTNVVKQRPPNNDFGVFYADPKRREPSLLLTQAIESLKQEIREVSPNIIVPLGGEALRALTGKTRVDKGSKGVMSGPIMSWRGSLLQTPLGKLCPTLHPAYVLRQYKSRVIVELDLRRVALESTSKDLRLPTHRFEINPSFDRVMVYLAQRPKRLAFDIETSGHFVRCLGLSSASDHAICIPFMSNEYRPMPTMANILAPIPTPHRNSHWTPEQEHRILTSLDSLFQDQSVEKIAQNFPFDALCLYRDFGIDCSPGFHLDTMGGWHTCFSELPKGLDFLCSILTRTPYYSDFDNSVDRETWLYNCYDAATTYEIAGPIISEMEEMGVWEYYQNHTHPAIISFARADTRGVLVDVAARQPIHTDVTLQVEVLNQKIVTATGGVIQNANSDKQVKDFFYKQAGCAPILNRKTGSETTDKHARETIRKRYPLLAPIVDMLDEHSTKATLLTFLEKPLGKDGRIRTHYNVFGTVTGRLASSEPLFDEGTNLQNMPRGSFRRLFISDPDWLFIKADLSQAEFRIVVWKAQIRRIIEKYLTDPSFDVHRMIASLIFQIAEAQINKEQRSTAKNGVYAGQYHVGYDTAARTYKLTYQMAKLVLDRFHQLFPEIEHNFWRSIKSELLANRCIIGPMGRKRMFFDRYDNEMERQAFSHYAQHLVGDIINRAWNLADELWDWSKAFPVLQVHDEIVAMAHKDHVIEHARFLKRLMEYPVQIDGTPEPLVIPAEVAIGKNWHDVVLLENYEKDHLQSNT